MAFRFTLEAVLRYRQSLEDRELLRLQALMVRRATLQRELQEAGEAYGLLQDAMRHGLRQGPTPAVEIHFSTARLKSIQRQREFLHTRLEELQGTILAQTTTYRQERQKREVLESLRDLQLRNYRLIQQRREQAMLDELHLMRHGRKPFFAE